MTARLFRRQVLHGAHHLAGRSERDLVGDASDAEVGDLHTAVGRDQQISRLDIPMYQPSGVGGLQGSSGLGDDIEDAVSREHTLTLENRTQRLTGHELHDEVGTAVFFSVVEDVGDSLVIDKGCMPRLGTETLEEPGVTEVLVLQDLDGDGATDNQVCCLPHLTHAADGDAT